MLRCDGLGNAILLAMKREGGLRSGRRSPRSCRATFGRHGVKIVAVFGGVALLYTFCGLTMERSDCTMRFDVGARVVRAQSDVAVATNASRSELKCLHEL